MIIAFAILAGATGALAIDRGIDRRWEFASAYAFYCALSVGMLAYNVM